MERMTIHRALGELKLIENKITKLFSSCKDFTFVATKAEKDSPTYKEKWATIKSTYDRITSLITRHDNIKKAIFASNAVTKVTIAGDEYTVAEAISQKSFFCFKKNLAISLIRSYNNSLAETKYCLENYNENFQKYLASTRGDSSNLSDSQVKELKKIFDETYVLEVIDPIKALKSGEQLDEKVADFMANVDYVLSESNATTFIEIDD